MTSTDPFIHVVSDQDRRAEAQLRTLAQAAVGRTILTILEEPPATPTTFDELLKDLTLVHQVLASDNAAQPSTVAVHELALELLAGRL